MGKKILVPIVALIAVCVLCIGCQKKSQGLTIRSGTLTIGMEVGYPPMEYYSDDGKTLIGFDIDLGKAIAAKMGLKVKFIDTDWDGIFNGVNEKKYDCIMSSVTVNPQRLAVYNFSKPYISNTLALVLLKNSKRTIRTPLECGGLTVAYQLETTSEAYMEELAADGMEYTPHRYDKIGQCFEDLKSGVVDVVASDLLVAYDYIAPENSPFEIVWTNPEDEKFGVCMKKGDDALTEAVNKALDELFGDGTMLFISRKIFGMDLVTAARR